MFMASAENVVDITAMPAMPGTMTCEVASRRRRSRRTGRGRAAAAGSRRPAAPGCARAVRRLVRVRADRRRHPHGDRTARHRDRRADRRQAAHRPQPQRPGRTRPAPVRAPRRSRADGAHPRAATGARPQRGRRKRPRPTLPGFTHLQRAQPVLLAHHLLARLLGAGRDVDRWHDCLERRRRVAAGCRRAGRFEPAARSDFVADELGLRAPFENSLDAVSDRDFVAEALFVADDDAAAPVADRRRDRAVVDRGVRIRPARRRVRDRLVDAAAEEEPRHRRARTRQGGPPDRRSHRACSRRSRACRSRTTAICRRTRSRCSTRSTRARCRWPRSAGLMATIEFVEDTMTGGRRQPVNAATDLAEHLVEQGTPFREAHALVGGLVRQAVERGRPARRAGRERSASRSRRAAVARTGQRRAPAHDTGRWWTGARRARSSKRRRGRPRRAAPLARAVTLRRAVLRPRRPVVAPELLNKVLVPAPVRARLVEVEAYTRRRRSREPFVPRADAAQRVRCSAAPGHALRVLHLRDPLVRERGVRSGSTPHAVLLRAGRAARGPRRDARAAGQGAPRRRSRARGPGAARPGVRLRPLVRRHRPHAGAGADRRRRHAAARHARGVGAHRTGRGKGDALPYRFYVPGDPHVSRPLREARPDPFRDELHRLARRCPRGSAARP